MPDSTPVNSSASIGTSAAFTQITGPSFNCRCCTHYVTADEPRWELRNLDWVCQGCALLLEPMHRAGAHRSKLAFDFLSQPVKVTSGWDL